MSWYLYAIFCTLGFMLALLIIGFKHVKSLINYSFVYLMVFYFTYVVRPVLSYVLGDGLTMYEKIMPGITEAVSKTKFDIALAIFFSVVFFAIGYKIQISKTQTTYDDSFSMSKTAKKSLVKFSLILIFVGYLSFLFAQRGFLTIRPNQTEYISTNAGTIYANSTGYLELANYLVVSGSLLFYASTGRIGISLILGSFWIINQVYQGNARFMFLTFALGLIGIWVIRGSKPSFSKRQALIIGVIGLLSSLLLIMMRSDRYFLQQNASIKEVSQSTLGLPVDQALGDLSGFEGSWYYLQNLKEIHPDYGASIFYNIFINPIPRILWPSKPLPGAFSWNVLFSGIGDHISNTYINRLWYISYVKGAIGYALSDWGLLGILINFVMAGLFFGWLERNSLSNKSDPIWGASYGAGFGMLSMMGRASIFNIAITYLLIFFLPYLFIHKWNKRYHRMQFG